MRVVDMENHHVVKCGVPWPYSSTPNSKNMITQLERNEALVTWIQPNTGEITDQFPAIRIRDHYYTMSLRMMKAVWR
jgi:transglutaminase/protease-like cytokinesis protein 3